MNKSLKSRLEEVLKEEATYIMRTDENIKEKISKMNDVINMQMIVSSFDELEPILKKYFKEKHQKEKWEER